MVWSLHLNFHLGCHLGCHQAKCCHLMMSSVLSSGLSSGIFVNQCWCHHIMLSSRKSFGIVTGSLMLLSRLSSGVVGTRHLHLDCHLELLQPGIVIWSGCHLMLSSSVWCGVSSGLSTGVVVTWYCHLVFHLLLSSEIQFYVFVEHLLTPLFDNYNTLTKSYFLWCILLNKVEQHTALTLNSMLFYSVVILVLDFMSSYSFYPVLFLLKIFLFV
jgi:hypothetical protein